MNCSLPSCTSTHYLAKVHSVPSAYWLVRFGCTVSLFLGSIPVVMCVFLGVVHGPSCFLQREHYFSFQPFLALIGIHALMETIFILESAPFTFHLVFARGLIIKLNIAFNVLQDQQKGPCTDRSKSYCLCHLIGHIHKRCVTRSAS